jgi:hypothetical protein
VPFFFFFFGSLLKARGGLPDWNPEAEDWTRGAWRYLFMSPVVGAKDRERICMAAHWLRLGRSACRGGGSNFPPDVVDAIVMGDR